MGRASKKKDIGGWFQEELQGCFKELARADPVIWHRFPDTKSAQGNFLSTQPGDFMFIAAGHPILIEAKASHKHKSLRSCLAGMVRDSQAGYHRMWLRAGATCFFVFYSSITDVVEFWASEDICAARAAGRPLPAEVTPAICEFKLLGNGIRSVALASIASHIQCIDGVDNNAEKNRHLH